MQDSHWEGVSLEQALLKEEQAYSEEYDNGASPGPLDLPRHEAARKYVDALQDPDDSQEDQYGGEDSDCKTHGQPHSESH